MTLKPNIGETHKEFISRFLSNEEVASVPYPRRVAMANSAFFGPVAGDATLSINSLQHNHDVMTTDVPWDQVDTGILPREAFVWQAPNTNKEDQSTWQFPHHVVEGGVLKLHEEALELALNSTDDNTPPSVVRHLQKHADALKARSGRVSGLRHLMSNLIRHETLDELEYIVGPVVLICEGVHNGLFYPASEICKFPDSWNGRPVVINHPDLGGKPVTANSPEVVERQTVGQLFNTTWDDETKKLRSEIWINVTKCKNVEADILELLENGANIEVSTGLFTENDQKEGTWFDEPFFGTVYNYRPDHLALLPDTVGACSWEDGAGFPRNNEEENMDKKKLITLARKMGLAVNELSHSDIREALSNAVRPTITVGYAWVRDVFDKTFVYEHDTETDGITLYRQGYSVDAAGNVILTGDPVKVRVDVSYLPVTDAGTTTNDDKTTEGSVVANKKREGKMERKVLVDSLIANGIRKEEDRDGLMAMTDEELTSAICTNFKTLQEAAAAAQTSTEGEGTGEGDEDEGTPTANQQLSKEEFLANAPEEYRASLMRAVKRDEQIKVNMVATLVANKGCPFTKAELDGKPIEELEKLVALSGVAKKDVDYSGMAPADINTNAEGDAVPAMPRLCPESK